MAMKPNRPAWMDRQTGETHTEYMARCFSGFGQHEVKTGGTPQPCAVGFASGGFGWTTEGFALIGAGVVFFCLTLHSAREWEAQCDKIRNLPDEFEVR